MIELATLKEKVPTELQNLKQWVCWEARPNENRVQKVPVMPSTRRNVNINIRSNWLTFEEAIHTCQIFKLDGIGFVFTSDDPYVGIDIDHCVDGNGKLTSFAMDIVKQMGSYTEVSPSGKGIHIICRGILPQGRNKNEALGLEIYDRNRFFTITGKVIEGYSEIQERTVELIRIYNSFLAKTISNDVTYDQPRYLNSFEPRNKRQPSEADKVMEILSRMKNHQQIIDLYRGHWQPYFNTQNQADLAFCNALAFATRKNPELMDQIFRESGLYRKKWDEVHYSNGMTYGASTIQKAIDSCTVIYDPKFNKENRSEKPQTKLPDWYEKKEGTGKLIFKPGVLAKHLCESMNVKFIVDSLHKYENGVYVELDDMQARSIIQDHLLMDHMKASHVKDTLELWKIRLAKDTVDFTEHEESIINFKNGLYNWVTREFVPHTPDFISKIQINCSYIKGAECPKFLNFISETFDQDVIPVVQEIMGYLMVPVTKAQKAFIFYGPGRTGKSTLIALIESLIGESNTSHVPLQKLEDRFDKASLFGKLLNTCADLPAKPLTDTAAFKILTGEDILHAERKFKEPFSFKNKARLLFSCNQLPFNPVDHTDGFYRRLLIIPFIHQVPEEKINPNLLDELKEELDGIAQWALQGLERLASNNYVFSQSCMSKQLLDDYKSRNNNVNWFIENYCIFSPESKSYSKDLYEYYAQVCKMNGMQPKPIHIFVTELLQFYGTSIQRKREPKTRRAIFQGICFNKKIV